MTEKKNRQENQRDMENEIRAFLKGAEGEDWFRPEERRKRETLAFLRAEMAPEEDDGSRSEVLALLVLLRKQ